MEISYRLQFIYSPKFIAGSLSSYVNNLAEGIHKIKKKYGRGDENCGIEHKDYYCFLEYTNFKDDLIEYKMLML